MGTAKLPPSCRASPEPAPRPAAGSTASFSWQTLRPPRSTPRARGRGRSAGRRPIIPKGQAQSEACQESEEEVDEEEEAALKPMIAPSKQLQKEGDAKCIAKRRGDPAQGRTLSCTGLGWAWQYTRLSLAHVACTLYMQLVCKSSSALQVHCACGCWANFEASTVDWQIPPPEALADPLGHVRRAILASLPANACERVRKLVNAGDGALRAPLFNDVEVEEMRGAVCACLGVGRAWATEQFPCTPYRFNLMERVATQLRDVDAALPGVLKVGSPTRVRCTIPASSVWRPTASADQDACDVEPDDLDICESNHWSAVEVPERVRELLEEEISAGYVAKFTGDLAALQERFPAGNLAVGKLGLVRKPGKADRLIGDSRASRASPQAKFSEKVEVAAIGYFSQALDRYAEHAHELGHSSAATPCSEDWMLLSIDVKYAHKSPKTAPEDVGFAVFQLNYGAASTST